MSYGERKLRRRGWKYDRYSGHWTSPYTLIDYSYENALRIEKP